VTVASGVLTSRAAALPLSGGALSPRPGPTRVCDCLHPPSPMVADPKARSRPAPLSPSITTKLPIAGTSFVPSNRRFKRAYDALDIVKAHHYSEARKQAAADNVAGRTMARSRRASSQAEADRGGDVGPEHVTASIGVTLRESRGSRYSIEELAKLSGVSAGRISQLERGLANPSFATLWKLSKALDLPFGAFFDHSEPGERERSEGAQVVRSHERKRISLPHDGLLYELLTPNVQRKLEVFRYQLPPRFDNSKAPLRHDGEELVHVLQGSIVVSVAGELYELHEGDSITYNADQPHYNKNVTDQLAIAIAAITPPSF
jgi:transcriptional regulator with XRE-family HTH domain